MAFGYHVYVTELYFVREFFCIKNYLNEAVDSSHSSYIGRLGSIDWTMKLADDLFCLHFKALYCSSGSFFHQIWHFTRKSFH